MKKEIKILLILLMMMQVACTESSVNKEIKINNKGVDINYCDSGQGDTVLFFIHGWGINQTYWINQVKHFSNRYRVVTMDLPGFGESGKNRKSWTVEEYAADVNAVLEKLNLQNVILVGHSMSGSIIVETALRHPSKVIGLVGIDNLKDAGIIMSTEMEKEGAAFYNNARKDFKMTVSKEMVYLFAASTDSLVRKRVMNDILNSDPEIAVTCLENLDKYPFVAKLQSVNKTIFLINSDYIPTDTLAFRKEHIEYKLLNMGSTGHYPMIENSEKFNLLLEKVLHTISETETVK